MSECKIEMKSIFRVELHFPNPKPMHPPLHPLFPGLSPLLSISSVSFCKWVTPMQATHASGTVSKPGASCYDFWFPVSCKKYSPPPHPSCHSQTQTHFTPHSLSKSKQSRAVISFKQSAANRVN